MVTKIIVKDELIPQVSKTRHDFLVNLILPIFDAKLIFTAESANRSTYVGCKKMTIRFY